MLIKNTHKQTKNRERRWKLQKPWVFIYGCIECLSRFLVKRHTMVRRS